jgi:hypothetical protein
MDDEELLMAAMAYYVALAFKRSEDGGDIVAWSPKEARSAEQAIRIAGLLAAEGHKRPTKTYVLGLRDFCQHQLKLISKAWPHCRARLDVSGGVSLISSYFGTNNFKREIICQPFIGDWHSFISLFTSCIVKQGKSSLQKLLRSVIIGRLLWHIHSITYTHYCCSQANSQICRLISS